MKYYCLYLVWVEALRWDSKPYQGPCLPQQIWNTGGHGTGCLQRGCFPLNTNRGQCQHWQGWNHYWELQILTIWGLSKSLIDPFSTPILFWEQTTMRWGLVFKSLGHASYLILLGKWSTSLNVFIAQILTDFRKTVYTENHWTSHATGRLASLLEVIMILNVS